MDKNTRHRAEVLAIFASNNIDMRALSVAGYETAHQLAKIHPAKFKLREGARTLHFFEAEYRVNSHDMWSLRRQNFLHLLGELLDQRHRGDYSCRNILDAVAVETQDGIKALLRDTLILGGSSMSSRRAAAWIAGHPGLCENSVREFIWSDKAIEQYVMLTMPFVTGCMTQCEIYGEFVSRESVKALAHEVSTQSGVKLAAGYELVSALAGFESWNHFSAKLV